jgi:hypothetical protein
MNNMEKQILTERIEELERLIQDPNTPQGKVKELRMLLFDLTQKLIREKEQEWKNKHNVSYNFSDDYAGLDTGPYSFYYGYEVTKCPIKSHKDDEDCYEKNCDEREWCFEASINGKVVMTLTSSELGGDVNCMDGSGLLKGIGIFLQSLPINEQSSKES